MGNPTWKQPGAAAVVALAMATFLSAGLAQAQVPDPSGLSDQALVLMNKERAAQGVPALTRQCDLDKAAARHANDMATHNFFDHTGSDGSQWYERILQSGYASYGGHGPGTEIIAAGSAAATAEGAVQTWMRSTVGHRESLLGKDYQEVGVAVAYRAGTQYGYYWCVVLAGGGGRKTCDPTPATGGTGGQSPVPALQAQSATLEGKIRSVEGVRTTSIRFDNVAAFPVQIYWLNYEGKRVLYGTLAPQQSYVQPTYVSHPWLLARSLDSAPLVIFEATLQASSARIDGTTTPTQLLPVESPSLAADARSRDLGGATVIEFVNSGPETVQVFWIDHNGQRVPYNTLQKDKGYQQQTYVGHIWLLTDHNGKALGIVEPTTSGGTVRFAFDARP